MTKILKFYVAGLFLLLTFSIIVFHYVFKTIDNDVVQEISPSEKTIYQLIQKQCGDEFTTCKVELSDLFVKDSTFDSIYAIVSLGEKTSVIYKGQNLDLPKTFLSSQLVFLKEFYVVKQEPLSLKFNTPFLNSISFCSNIVKDLEEGFNCLSEKNIVFTKQDSLFLAYRVKTNNVTYFYLTK